MMYGCYTGLCGKPVGKYTVLHGWHWAGLPQKFGNHNCCRKMLQTRVGNGLKTHKIQHGVSSQEVYRIKIPKYHVLNTGGIIQIPDHRLWILWSKNVDLGNIKPAYMIF